MPIEIIDPLIIFLSIISGVIVGFSLGLIVGCHLERKND